MGQSKAMEFRRACAIVLLRSVLNNKQDALAVEIYNELQLAKKDDGQLDGRTVLPPKSAEAHLRPIVSRVLSGDVDNSRPFKVVPHIFSRLVVAGDYPAHFVSWLDRALDAYDLVKGTDGLGSGESFTVRTLIAEAKLYFSKPRRAGQAEMETEYPRYEAARQFMLGMIAVLEQRTIKSGPKVVAEGIEHFDVAIRALSTPKNGSRTLSPSDEFLIALSLKRMDWLFSELPDSAAQRRKTLTAHRDLGTLTFYEWLADATGNWWDRYNIAEIYGVTTIPDGDSQVPPTAAMTALKRAIEMNPRLSVFGEATGFDGVEEPLNQAPALRHVLPALEQKEGKWLANYRKVYRQHADLYKTDVKEGVKAMRTSLLKMKNVKSVLTVIAGAVSALAASSFVLDTVALAKPIFS